MYSIVDLEQSTRIVNYHEAIVSAIEQKDKKRARELLEADLKEAGDIFEGMEYND